MRIRRSSSPPDESIHRYFPEWADRPAVDGVPREAERNSYSAGGYAEEFGYAAQPGLPAPRKPLTGDPERSKQWRIQIGAVHPGYPECPKPLDRDSIRWLAVVPCGDEMFRALSGSPGTATHAIGQHATQAHAFRVLRVGERRIHVGLGRRLGLLWKSLGMRHHAKLW
jgi:hypothetical protein